jgi:hypothetical protein
MELQAKKPLFLTPVVEPRGFSVIQRSKQRDGRGSKPILV